MNNWIVARRTWLIPILLTITLSGSRFAQARPCPAPLDDAAVKAFVAFAQEARQAAAVPGMALGVTHGDRVVVAQGFGHRVQDGDLLGAPVDADTIFAIGSVSKILTTLMMAQFVGEGHFTWQTPAARVHPGFALENSADTASITMADTVCACVTLSPHDIDGAIFSEGRQSTETLMQGLRRSHIVAPRGAGFTYSNLLVGVGGGIAAHAAFPNLPMREAYETAMQTRIFEPLGMHATTFAPEGISNVAQPHGVAWKTGRYMPFPLADERWSRAIGPAGGVWTSAHDATALLRAQLAALANRPNALHLDAAAMAERFIPRVSLTPPAQPDEVQSPEVTYGLGVITTKRDDRVVHWHNGALQGYHAFSALYPHDDTGLMVLTNGAMMGSARHLLTAIADGFQALLEGRPQGLSEARAALHQALQTEQQQQRQVQAMYETCLPKRWAQAHAGCYAHPELGTLCLDLTDGGQAVAMFADKHFELARRTAEPSVLVVTSPFLQASTITLDGEKRLTLNMGSTPATFTR